MRVTIKKSFTMALVILAASSLLANQAADKDKLKKAKPKQASIVQIPTGLALDDQQKEAIAALNAEYRPKLEQLKQQQAGVLTAEQRQALADAKNAAKDSNIDKAELAKRLREAVQLTDAQIQEQAELKKKMVELNQEIRDRFMKLLTAEQREILTQSKIDSKKASGKPVGERKPAAEKPAAKKPLDKKPLDKKPAAKKPSNEKPADKKSAAEKPPAKKPTGEKPAQKGSTDKKTAGEKKSDANAT